MAIVANTFTTFDAKGIREDLANVIYNISPEETPLISSFGRERAENTLFEWQTDSLAAPDTSNAQIEGNDYTTFAAVSPTVRVGNHTQISAKTLIVSGTEETVNKAGRRSELAYQTAKRGVELRRDMEAITFGNQGGSAGDSATARKTASLGAWLKSNTVLAGDGGDPTYTAGVPGAARTDGTQAAFTVTMHKTVLQSMWTGGAELRTLYVGPFNKGVVSGFAGVATKNYDLSGTPRPTAIIGSVDVYVSEFGVLRILPSRFMRERDAYYVDPEFATLAELRPFRREALAKTGDATKRLLVVEWGLKMRQEAAFGGVFDLTTA